MTLNNLGIGRWLALAVALTGAILVIGAVAITTLIYESNGATLAAVAASLGVVLTGLVGAFKATESADSTAQLVKQISTRLDSIDGHIGELRRDVDTLKDARPPYQFKPRPAAEGAGS